MRLLRRLLLICKYILFYSNYQEENKIMGRITKPFKNFGQLKFF